LVSRSCPKDVLAFLRKNEYLDLYIFLISSVDNLRNRAELLNRNIQEYDTRIKEMLLKIKADPKSFVPENKEVSKMFKNIHYTHLEIIQKINILVELLAIYYHTLRTNMRDLPGKIGRKDFTSGELFGEFRYFNNQSLDDIRENFRYPDVTDFAELSSDDRNELNELFNKSTKSISDAFRWIYKFQKNFRPIYNKYKHTLSEFTGIFGVDEKKKHVLSQIFLRDKQNDSVHTYMIPIGSREVIYLSEVSARAFKLLNAIIDTALLFLVNKERTFLPRTLFIDKQYETKLKELYGKIQSCIITNFTSKMIMKPPDEKEREKINKKLEENHILIMKRDILDLETLLREGVKMSKT
jgi:hypothetical protein